MKTVTTNAIHSLIHQVFFSIGIHEPSYYELIKNDSINATIIIWDRRGMSSEEIVEKFNSTVKYFISSVDKVEMQCYNDVRFIVTTNYSIIEEAEKPIKVITQSEENK